MQVAQTILAQLGGNRFIAMTGAKQFVGGDNLLQFSIARAPKNKANKVKITLVDDLYAVEFWKLRGVKCDMVESVEMVYGNKLAEVFTERTGLDTRL